MNRSLISFVCCVGLAMGAAVAEPVPWHSGEMHEFHVVGRAAKLVYPKKEAAGRPWIWRMEFFGHEPQADAALLAAGWHVAYIDVQNLYGGPPAMEAMDAFYQEMVNGRGLAKKVVLEGFSRGGLFSLNWGIRHPQRVSSMYNDAPVCDFSVWPGGAQGGKRSDADWDRLLKVYQLTDEQAQTGQHSPINRLEPLAKAKVPLLHVCGAADEVVPFDKNTERLAARYRELGGHIEVIAKPGVKHHPHSLVDPKPIVDFVLGNFKPAGLEVKENAQNPAEPRKELPNVLIIGDSISIGYTPTVRTLLAGKANVWRIPVNGGPTSKGVAHLDSWLAERKWSVIHFNWGLHDLKHVGAKGDALVDVNDAKAKIQVPLANYSENLTKLVGRLKATGAQLLWAETTPVPERAKGRKPSAVADYNAAAAEIMKANGIPSTPLGAKVVSQPDLQKPKDVHFTEKGSEVLGTAVAEAIRAKL